jgi:uncharacterized protein (DUF697 family)/tellurite resistance protein
MTNDEQKALLTIALAAAFADGTGTDAERREIRRISESLPGAADLNLPALYQDVLLKRANVEAAARTLTTPETRELAYELAAGVCDADGAQSGPERAFLASLRAALGMSGATAQAIDATAEALATAPLAAGSSFEPPVPATRPPTAGATPVATTMPAAEMDKMILNYAILNGALELLPDSLASMAIIPLQMKMVYRIGKAHGFELDRGHVTDFLATVGVGLASQYVEQFGRKLIGGLLGKIGGGILRTAGSVGTGAAMSFATTYALGHVAKRYYAGGRRLDAAALKEAFAGMLGEARALQGKYAGAIEQQARSLDVGKVLAMVKGGQ